MKFFDKETEKRRRRVYRERELIAAQRLLSHAMVFLLFFVAAMTIALFALLHCLISKEVRYAPAEERGPGGKVAGTVSSKI